MNDIVERLRARAKSLRGMGSIAHVDADTDDEAADEIARLRAGVERLTRENAELRGYNSTVLDPHGALRAENEALLAANRDVMLHWDVLKADYERLRAALRDARECIEAWAGYASEYFREKHDLAGDLARIDAALDGQPAPSERHLAPDHQAAMHGALRRSVSVVQPAPSGWRPIETAPKDGTQFLTWDSHYGIRVGRCVVRPDHDDWLSYMDAYKGSSKGGIRATHWMPLPPAPGKEEA